MTLELANQESASSSRTSTSQAQLDHDREVALVVQANWDAETNTSPESNHTASSANNDHPRQASAGVRKTSAPHMRAGPNSDVCSHVPVVSNEHLIYVNSLRTACATLRGFNNRR